MTEARGDVRNDGGSARSPELDAPKPRSAQINVNRIGRRKYVIGSILGEGPQANDFHATLKIETREEFFRIRN